MSVTILEALENAEHNLKNAKTMPFLLDLATEQLHNAVELLNKNYGLETKVEPLLEKWGNVEDVPYKEQE